MERSSVSGTKKFTEQGLLAVTNIDSGSFCEDKDEEDSATDDLPPIGKKEVNPFSGLSIKELYKITECISSGSPGSVYLVKAKKESKKMYVLKKIECHDESVARKVFYEELELKNLDHPYVTRYQEFFVTFEKQGSTVFVNIISEYFPEGNLSNFIRGYRDKKAMIPEQVVKKILGEIFSALVYIHDKGYLHRNIKPNNIFLKKGAMVLGDLGVASIMGDLRTNTRQTFQGTVFMAPEIGQQVHDIKTDLFSVGGVLLNILSSYILSEQEFYHKLGQIKESPEELNGLLDLISAKYSKSMINAIQMLLRHKHTNRPSTLEFIKSGFVQECMAQADASHFDRPSWQNQDLGPRKNYQLTESRDDVFRVLHYISEVEDEECLADGLSALADILRDNDKAHLFIDQVARNTIIRALRNNLFHKDIQIAGCYVLSNLVVFAKSGDAVYSPEVFTMIHKVMTGHEYNPDVQLAAADLILALSANGKACQMIVQSGGIKDILLAMRHARYHATLNAICCLALWSLTSDSENLKIAMKEDAARDVCLALSTHKVSADVCEAGAAALMCLVLYDGCIDIINELDCAGDLVTAIHLHTRDAKVVKNCCKVLATIVEITEDCAFRFLASDNEDDSPTGIPTLLRAYRVHKDNADVVESIVKLLLELSHYDDIASELQAARIIPLLLSEVHKRYKANKAIIEPVTQAIRLLEISSSIPEQKKVVAISVQPAAPGPFRFGGEVKGNCINMLRLWKQDNQRGATETLTPIENTSVKIVAPQTLSLEKSKKGSEKKKARGNKINS